MATTMDDACSKDARTERNKNNNKSQDQDDIIASVSNLY